jgi:hypothetical protein
MVGDYFTYSSSIEVMSFGLQMLYPLEKKSLRTNVVLVSHCKKRLVQSPKIAKN